MVSYTSVKYTIRKIHKTSSFTLEIENKHKNIGSNASARR
jgi:hypothetical protein